MRINSKQWTELLLFVGTLAFSLAVYICAVELPNDDRLFGYLSGVGSGFSGGLLMALRNGEKETAKSSDNEGKDG